MQSASGGNPQDRNGAFSVGELNSPRVAPLHRYDGITFRGDNQAKNGLG
ncbi:MAG: hypothetical protein F6J98_40675 [Moorea sp. SIO4G2]|nr:hypothetical protein [Moorena sp. SIO4G2]NEQ85687.1 hypothetical protein [Moorena sp. SIO2I5]